MKANRMQERRVTRARVISVDSGSDALCSSLSLRDSVAWDIILKIGFASILVGICFCSTACTTTPRYVSARPECLEYSIAACRAAIVEDGLESGLIHYIPHWGDGTAHCVIWIKDRAGRERIYDPAFGIYRTLTDKDVVLHKGEGLDLGFYAYMLSPDYLRSIAAH